MFEEALYYPNIVLPGESWLKSNLLMFPSMRRIIPTDFVDDSPYIAPYLDKGLLRPAEIYSYGCYRAQDWFLSRIRSIIEENPRTEETLNVEKFRQKSNLFPATVHIGKLGDPIASFLLRHRLATEGRNGFLDMHPALGEALMSTIAIALAQEDGLKIVTENGKIHSWLRDLSYEDAVDALISDQYVLESGDVGLLPTSRETRLSLVLFSMADVSALDAEGLSKLQGEREALDELLNVFSEHCAKVPQMKNEEREIEILEEVANEIISKWKEDRRNFTNFWKDFFGTDLTKKSDSFLQRVATTVTPGLVAGGGVAALADAKLLAAGAGFGVALVVHAAQSWRSSKRTETESAFRYLTMCEKNGVAFTAS